MTTRSSGSKPKTTNNRVDSVGKNRASFQSKVNRRTKKRLSESSQVESSGFYRAFEDRYRGSRDLIKSRLCVYLSFIEPLKEIYSHCVAIDLGCGRGEWLELLEKNGFAAHGVDLDEGMLAACAELGLSATRQEAIEHLKSLDDKSQCIVSGFHFAEHISFASLKILVAESLRVLKPGGVLILETPNPENVAVGTTNFYLDPTHQRPIPPLLLSFLTEHQGFERVKILRLQEIPGLSVREDIQLKDVFLGVSPDYAVVAQKKARSEILLSFSEAFDRQYGIDLEQIADLYDTRIERQIAALDRRLGNAEDSAGGMVNALSQISALQNQLIEAIEQGERSRSHAFEQEQRAVAAETSAQEQEQRAVAAETSAQEQEQRAVIAEAHVQEQEQRAAIAEARALQQEERVVATETRVQEQEQRASAAEKYSQVLEQQISTLESQLSEINTQAQHWCQETTVAQQQVAALEHSLSWRITAPLRITYDIFRACFHGHLVQEGAIMATKLREFIQSRFISIIKWSGDRAQHSPAFRRFVLWLLQRYPGLQQKLYRIYLETQFKSQTQPANWSRSSIDTAILHPHNVLDEEEFLMISSSPSGVNANQQTPLESHFRIYISQP